MQGYEICNLEKLTRTISDSYPFRRIHTASVTELSKQQKSMSHAVIFRVFPHH